MSVPKINPRISSQKRSNIPLLSPGKNRINNKSLSQNQMAHIFATQKEVKPSIGSFSLFYSKAPKASLIFIH
jgi:hypothetical protein